MELEATKSSEWNKKTKTIAAVRLPSGDVMKMKRPTMGSLIRKGVIPTHCYQITMGQVDLTDPKKVTPEQFRAVIDLMAVYVSEAAVEPKVVLKDPIPEGAIHIDRVDDADLMYIFNNLGGERIAGGGESAALDSFSEKPEGAPDRPAGAEVQSSAVKPA